MKLIRNGQDIIFAVYPVMMLVKILNNQLYGYAHELTGSTAMILHARFLKEIVFLICEINYGWTGYPISRISGHYARQDTE